MPHNRSTATKAAPRSSAEAAAQTGATQSAAFFAAAQTPAGAGCSSSITPILQRIYVRLTADIRSNSVTAGGRTSSSPACISACASRKDRGCRISARGAASDADAAASMRRRASKRFRPPSPRRGAWRKTVLPHSARGYLHDGRILEGNRAFEFEVRNRPRRSEAASAS